MPPGAGDRRLAVLPAAHVRVPVSREPARAVSVRRHADDARRGDRDIPVRARVLRGYGTYLFIDSYIPIAVFLGMHLLFTDPSTSPRTELGRLIFGAIYGLSVIVLYAA